MITHLLSPLLLLTPRFAIRRALRKQFVSSPLPVAQIWQRTMALQATVRQQRPRHSLGVNHFLRFMEWNGALYRALLEHGLTPEGAGQLIEAINWEIFGTGTENVFMLSRLRSAKLQPRVQWVLDLMFATLFTKPFRKQVVPSTDGIAFDVTVCPVAAYFRQQGIPELTRFAACNLDHRMAQVWGVTLKRTQTVAAGDDRCDFRFKISPTGKS